MKKYIYVFLGILVSFFHNACTPDTGNRYYPAKYIPPITESNGTLYMFNPINDYNTSYFSTYRYMNNMWEPTSNEVPLNTVVSISFKDQTQIGNELIQYNNHKVTITDSNNTIVFQEALPTAARIAESLELQLGEDYHITFFPFLTQQTQWDKKRHIVSVAIDPVWSNDLGGKVYDFYYLSLYKQGQETWEIQKIIPTKIANQKELNNNFIESNYAYVPFYSLEGKANLCIDYTTKEMCFVMKNGVVTLQELFGEIYPVEYKEMLDDIYEDVIFEHRNYTFDAEDNMHLFYHKKEDIENDNQDYFWYGYFTKEDPKTPVIEQKIPWD